ncbi:MAG: T9SS type A sorting domain-containing protein [Candidatus Kapabacteria bacterium]|nr:T9SS type A sorting domain-containing protein [Candidatus Kapabacteria bacterium]
MRVRDSLMGFNLAIRFNPEKLRFHTMLTAGTLAELMEQRGFSAPHGEIRAYAFTLSRTVAGSRPLVAFLGDYQLKCPDTTHVQLQYVEFNEEFERRRVVVVDTLPKTIEARILDAPTRILGTQVTPSEWRVTEVDTVFTLSVRLDYDTAHELGRVATYVVGMPHWLRFVDASSDSVTWEQRGDTGVVRWTAEHGDPLSLSFAVVERRSDTAVLYFSTVPLEPCACVVRWSVDSVNIINTTPVGVLGQGEIVGETFPCGEPGEEAYLYDLQGRLLSRQVVGYGHRCLDLSGLPRGVYILQYRGKAYPIVHIHQ